jgi:hypothetical protein
MVGVECCRFCGHKTDTGVCGGPEHLKIETRLRDERVESVKDECVI